MPLRQAHRPPRATYRVQLNPQFTFQQLEQIIPYLDALGISDVYASPLFSSAPGSTHGYDVSDYRKINPELGGDAAFSTLTDRLASRSLGLLVDFVPNHMGISGPFNPWWRDVLERGRKSPYAGYFDIHWNSPVSPDRARILVPLLGDHYGVVLERGELRLTYGQEEFTVVYGDTPFPLRPRSYLRLVRLLADERGLTSSDQERLTSLQVRFEEFCSAPEAEPAEKPAPFRPLKQELAQALAKSPSLHHALEQLMKRINGRKGDPASFDLLDDILEEQVYRLARWKAGAHETNYRRFFAVDTLIGLRMEKEEVFAESHKLLGQLLHQGKITGLRIDHIDGLWDPHEYLERLQRLPQPGASGQTGPLYVIVEKILEGEELLPDAWAAHGTTGYEFIFSLSRLLTPAANADAFAGIYAQFTGQTAHFHDVVYEKKRLVLEEMFANAVNNLAASLHELIGCDRRWRDLTRHELTAAVREIMAGMEVYRTYRRFGEPCSQEDRHAIQNAFARAVQRNPRADPQAMEFVRDFLVGVYPRPGTSDAYQEAASAWTLTFQQYTGAVMAKAVEDTAFYTYNRHIALNEVGGDPSRFGGTVAEFHEMNERRLATAPLSMLTTSTHDTKVSEDVRARLYALGEIPEEWAAWLREWRRLNEGHKRAVGDGLAPDDNEEYRLYQILLGSWPLDDSGPDDAYRERVRDYMRKAVNEAKVNTTWIQPHEDWIAACDDFISGLLGGTDTPFLESFRPRAARLAHLGMVNSLTQTVLKLTVPGVPDIYQGNETWDFSLVDPDNRRPVDYERRQRLLEEVEKRSPQHLLRNWRDGGIKLRTVQAILGVRKAHPELFSQGTYDPLTPRGRFEDNVVGFSRTHQREHLIVVVPRLTSRLGCPPIGLVWEDTTIRLGTTPRSYRDVVTGRAIAPEETIALADLLVDLPFAVLLSTA